MKSGLPAAACCLLLVFACGCSRSKGKSGAAASASGLPAPVASGFPAPEIVSHIVNPKQEGTHAGPAGTVRGRVVATGDPALELPDVLAKIPAKCTKAKAAYGKLFREGPNRELADVLVAVTGYQGYVPEREDIVPLEADGCFWGTRTLALTFGQRLEIKSADDEAYIPELVGQRGQPQLIATPRGAAKSPVYPTRPGSYQLVDNLKLFMVADVAVLKYSTHTVTGLDGRFEIPDIPAGQVKVSVALPQTGAMLERTVIVLGGRPTPDLVFELPFDAAEYAKRAALVDGGAAPAAAGSTALQGSGTPSAMAASAPAKATPPVKSAAPAKASAPRQSTAAPTSSAR